MKRLFQLLLVVVVALLAILPFPLDAQAQARQGLPMVDQVFTTAMGEQVSAPVINTNGLTLGNFPDMQVTGELLGKLEKMSPLMDFSNLQQSVGQFVPLPEVLPIGSAFGAASLNMASIAGMSGTDLGRFSLNDIGGFKNLPISNLVQGIPGLGDLPVSEAPGIAAMVLNAQGLSPDAIVQQLGLGNGLGQLGSLGNLSVAQVLTTVPGLGDMKLTQLDPSVLSQLALDKAVPGFAKTAFNLIPGAAQVPIAGVPGLSNTPVGSLPQGLQLIPNPVPVRMDVVYGTKESNRKRPVSGTIPDSSNTLQPLACEKDCAHVEIIDLGTKKYTGYAWMSGEHKGPDCYGSFCALFGSEGPSGSHPYGPNTRIVLRQLSEKDASFQVALAFRFCATIPFEGPTCSSANAFEIPFMTLKEGQTFVISEPGGVVGMADPPPGFNPDGGDGSGAGGECSIPGQPIDMSNLDSISKAAINAMPSGYSKANAAKYIPHIISECARFGVTDPSAIGYVLSTAFHESDGFRTTNEDSRHYYDQCGWGEGLIQITWCSNKNAILQKLGLGKYQGIGDPRLHDPKTAAAAACVGMRDGTFTGRTMRSCGLYQGGKKDYYCARRIINADPGYSYKGTGTTMAAQLGKYSRDFENAIAKAQQEIGTAKASAGTDATKADTSNQPQSTSTPVASGCGSSDGEGIAGDPSVSGDQNNRIYQAAMNMRGNLNQSGVAETGYGNNGCMYAVDHVLMKAGIKSIGSSFGRKYTIDVADAWKVCTSGTRGKIVSASQAKKGDLLIMLNSTNGYAATKGHIGIVTGDGCTSSLSNSSSRANLVWSSDCCFSEAYGCGGYQRWVCRLN